MNVPKLYLYIFFSVIFHFTVYAPPRAAIEGVFGERICDKDASQDPRLYGFMTLPELGPCLSQRVIARTYEGSYCGTVESVDRVNKMVTVLCGFDKKRGRYKRDSVSWRDLFYKRQWIEHDRFFNHHVYSDISFEQWRELPKGLWNENYCRPLEPSYFSEVCSRFTELCKKQLPAEWFKDYESPQDLFVQKISLAPETRGHFSFLRRAVEKKFFIFGDIHGDAQSLLHGLSVLHKKNILDNSFKLSQGWNGIFLGDNGDRGWASIEVWYTLYRLKLANPDNVFLLRGNHETCGQNVEGGLTGELVDKMGYTFQQRTAFYRLYNLLPLALYLQLPDSNESIVCCHGMPDMGFRSQEFLASKNRFAKIGYLDRSTLPAELLVQDEVLKQEAHASYEADFKAVDKYPLIGFLWGDIDEDTDGLQYTSGRGFKLGPDACRALCERENIARIVRGHQHSGELGDKLEKENGVTGSMDSLIFTVCSAGILFDGKFQSSFLELSKNKEEEWGFTHHYAAQEQ